MMNSNSIHTPLRPVSLQNLNPGKFWTNTSISGWVDSIYSQSEVYIKHERELKEEELKQQQQSGVGSSSEPIDLDGMDIAPNNSNNNNNNSNNTVNNSSNNNNNNNSNNNMNMNLNSINLRPTTTTDTK